MLRIGRTGDGLAVIYALLDWALTAVLSRRQQGRRSRRQNKSTDLRRAKLGKG